MMDGPKERIEELTYEKDGKEGPIVTNDIFINSPGEFLVSEIVRQLLVVPQWKKIFADNIDNYKRMDYTVRQLPALRIYNEIAKKDFESWWFYGDVKGDIIFPASVRRTELQQIQDTVSDALLQQFRRPLFFDSLSKTVPGLNELGKSFSIDKSLGFEWGGDTTDYVPLTQIVLNFRIDLRIWDDYLEETDRTKDSPFEKVLGNLDRISSQIAGLMDDLETTEITIGTDQKISGG